MSPSNSSPFSSGFIEPKQKEFNSVTAVKVFTVCEKYQDNALLVEKLLVVAEEGDQQFDN